MKKLDIKILAPYIVVMFLGLAMMYNGMAQMTAEGYKWGGYGLFIFLGSLIFLIKNVVFKK